MFFASKLRRLVHLGHLYLRIYLDSSVANRSFTVSALKNLIGDKKRSEISFLNLDIDLSRLRKIFGNDQRNSKVKSSATKKSSKLNYR